LKLLNLQTENSEDVSDGEFIKSDNFTKLTEMIKELCAKVRSVPKLKHTLLARNDLIAVLSTFALVAEKKQTEYLYAFRVTINSALEKNKTLKNDVEQINQIVDQIIRGIYE